MFQKKKQHLIGLDLGSHTIKVMQIKEGKSAFKLQGFGLAYLPAGAFMEGKVKEPEAIASTIQKLTKHLKIKEKSVAISISGYEVMIKKIELPMMTEEELDSRMKEQLGQYIPYNIEEVNVDYEILGLAKERSKTMEVLLVAAKKESINDYIDLIRMAGLDPMVIDVDCFALINAHESAFGVGGEEGIALVDIGANKASIYIVNSGTPAFTRDVSIGGSQITEAIRSRFRVTYETAERIKLGESSDKAPARVLEEIFLSTTQGWVSEVKRVFDFYYNNYPDNRIDRILLSGGSCRVPGLDRLFQERIGGKVEIFNPLARLEYDQHVFDPSYIDYVGPQMAVCLGLALRRTNEK